MKKTDSGRVLFVDDEECIRELASETFPDAGYEIILASNGVDALEKLWGSVFDVVVSDIMMPKLDGVELYYGAIRENPQLKERFIFTTGLPSLKTVSFLSQNSCPHLYKPYQMTDLLQVVEGLMESKNEATEKRISKRFDLVTEGLLTDEVVNKHSPLVVETQDISKSGVRLKYFGNALLKDVKVELNLRAMDIKRTATVVWSNTVNERSFSGLTFA
ncbi:MAG: response regulator [Proteobacteria bacterium]|nr:response regulator [Pseudomonadota bacterium]